MDAFTTGIDKTIPPRAIVLGAQSVAIEATDATIDDRLPGWGQNKITLKN